MKYKNVSVFKTVLGLVLIRQGIGEFSPTAPFQLEKNLQHAPHLVAAGMPLLLGLIVIGKRET